VSPFAVEFIDNETEIAVMFQAVCSAQLAPGRSSQARLSLVLADRDQELPRGPATAQAGRVAVQAGRVAVQAGRVAVQAGRVAVQAGRVAPQRVRIADAATRCVARTGVTKTTVDDVAREAGCSRATVYRTFPGGKEEVVAAVVDTEVARLFSAVAVAMGAAEDLEDAVVAGILTAASAMAGHAALGYVLDNEPGVLLPYLCFAAMDRVIAAAARFAAPFLVRWLDPEAAGRVADFSTRVLLSYLATHYDTIFTWDYEKGRRPKLDKLYEKAKTTQWNGQTDLPWDIEVDQEKVVVGQRPANGGHDRGARRERHPVREVGRQGVDAARRGEPELDAVAVHARRAGRTRVHGQDRRVRPVDRRQVLRRHPGDGRGRHVEVFSKYLDDKLSGHYPINAHLRMLLDDIISDSAGT
jgi:AcrR family transcriptional regulator